MLYRPILCLLVKLPHSVEAAVDADRRLEALVDAQLLLPLLTEAALDRACCGVHVDFSESDSGEFAAELDTAARTREIETQRQQAASSLDVNPGDLTLDEQNNQFELTEEARRRREEERLDDLEADLLADLDSQTPGVDLDESDVDFSETDEGIEATLTDEAAAEVQQEQNSLLSDLDAGDTQPAAKNQQEFVDMAFEVWEGEVRNRLKTEADINDSELQHGAPHMVEVRYE